MQKISLIESYNEAILLLTEGVAASNIRKSIADRKIVKFRYDTKGDPNLAPDWRTVQIYAYGAMKPANNSGGNPNELQPVIRGFELMGDFSGNKKGGWKGSKVPAWKLFYVNRIKNGSFSITEEGFDEPFSDIYPNIPPFNPDDDKSMDVVWAIIEFPERPKELAYNKRNVRLKDPSKQAYNMKFATNKQEPTVKTNNNVKNSNNIQTTTNNQVNQKIDSITNNNKDKNSKQDIDNEQQQ